MADTLEPTASHEAEANMNRTEAKSRFNNAINEAKAGAAALKAEATERAGAYRDQAKVRSTEYQGQAKVKANDMAVEGKAKASEAISAISRMVNDNAATLDEKIGPKYGDYARTASRSLNDTAAKLDEKSVEELTEDARQFVRNSPGMAIGLAAFAGYIIARTFSSNR